MYKTTYNEKAPLIGGRLRSASFGCAGTQNNIIILHAWVKKMEQVCLKYKIYLYNVLFCVKQPYAIWLRAGAPILR